jgi:FMN phosphatase YigB (HAD superfamily)
MTTIKSIFFDIGDRLGTAVLLPPPVRLVRLDLFPYVTALLRSLADRSLRLGIISNTGDMDGASVDEILNKAGIRDLFDAMRSSTVIPPARKDCAARAQGPAGGVQVVSSSSG